MDHQSNTANRKQPNNSKNRNRKRKSEDDTTSLDIRPKRVAKRPDRYGKRVSAINRNVFFEQFNNDDSPKRDNENSPNNLNGSHRSNSLGSTSSTDSLTIDSVSNNDSAQSVSNTSNDTDHILHESDNNLEKNSPHSSIGYNAFQSAAITKLDEILKRISYIEKDNCKTQARLNKLERTFERYFERLNGGGIDVMEAVSEAYRATFGVPISSKMALDKFEMDLINSDYKSKLVILGVSYNT